MLVSFEFVSINMDNCSSLGWAFLWFHIVDLGWLVIVVRDVIVGGVLAVQGYVDACHRDVVESWWHDTRELGGVDDSCDRLDAKITEDAEGVVGVADGEGIGYVIFHTIELSSLICIHDCSLLLLQLRRTECVSWEMLNEWVHTGTDHNDLAATAFGSVVGVKLGNGGVWVVPIVKYLAGILLLVEGNREANGLGSHV